MAAILRSFQRPQTKAFSLYLLRQMNDTRILGADGNPMGQELEVDRKRIDATGRRIVRGLYYIEKNVNLGSPQEFRVASRAGIEAKDRALQKFAELYAGSQDPRAREVGNVFSYAVGFYPTFSVWLLLLYGYFSWLASIKFGEEAQ
jgi:hypothetical protein